jgi:outer membrane protein assembly factor BamA
MKRFLFALCLVVAAFAQDPVFPLESLNFQGSSLPQETVAELSGLKIGAAVNKAAIEASCQKLQETGIFESVAYRYSPGPKHGYAVTLTLADQAKMVDAAIDIPGVDEAGVWAWLITRFPRFQRRVPADGTAQQYLAGLMETHLAGQLGGAHVVSTSENDTVHNKFLISFQPDRLPRVISMNFTGNQEFTSADLNKILAPVAANAEYTERRFRQYVELNLGRAYESHGMYRVRFLNIKAEKIGAGSVSVTTGIEEGAKFTLGQVNLIGDGLPVKAMLAAAGFKQGQLANWEEIQNGIWATERPLKRTGYFQASARPERVLQDGPRILDVNITYNKGPLYHTGELRLQGLPPAAEQKARALWKPRPGDPYDFLYSTEFLQELTRAVDLRAYKIASKTEPGPGDHTFDFVFVFESRR